MIGALTLTGLLSMSLLPLPQDAPQAPSPAAVSEFVDPDFRDFHRVLGHNLTRGLFSEDNIPALLVGTGAMVATLPFDDDIREALEGKANAFGEIGDVIGGPVALNAATGSVLLISAFTDDPKFRSFAFTLAQAKILESAVKFGLKLSIERERPNAKNSNSLPSGHATGAFTFATVIHRYYGTKAAIVSYALASLIAVSRLESGNHFASDIVFGATLGILSGRTALRGSGLALGDTRLAIAPYSTASQKGVAVLLEF